MDDVKRYDLDHIDISPWHTESSMIEQTTGRGILLADWVRAEDYDAMKERAEKAETIQLWEKLRMPAEVEDHLRRAPCDGPCPVCDLRGQLAEATEAAGEMQAVFDAAQDADHARNIAETELAKMTTDRNNLRERLVAAREIIQAEVQSRANWTLEFTHKFSWEEE